MNISLSAFAPENLVSRDMLVSIILRMDLVLTYGIPPEFRGGAYYICLFKTAILRHRVSPEYIGSRNNCVSMPFTTKSPPA